MHLDVALLTPQWHAGEIALSAFGHYPLVSLQLSKLLKASATSKNAQQKGAVQRLLLCPHLSRVMVVYGAEADSSSSVRGLLVCGLQSISSRLRELHPLLLIAAELRTLLSSCAALQATLVKSLTSARKTFVKLFALFPNSNSNDPEERWNSMKEPLRCDLQVWQSGRYPSLM